jgi:prophage tail gpP-like protein
MADVVTLAIDGQRYEGWKAVRITRAIDTLSGDFSLQLTDRERQGADRLKLRAGSACEVQVDGETLITGFIDRVIASIDGGSHSLSIDGRDKSADLIDCSAVPKFSSWVNVPLETIASQIAAPFGITITARASTKPAIRRFALQQGESVFAAIDRLCRYRGLLAVSTADGMIELVTPMQGTASMRIEEGENALALSITHDVSERFSEYLLKGQSSGDDMLSGKAAAGPSGKASDPGVKRYRPLLLIGEEQSDADGLARRAKWEATTRAARAQEASVTVQGWRMANGALWNRNVIAQLVAPSLYVDAPMLVTSATLERSDRGTVTSLLMSPPEAYSQLAIPEQADASSVKGRS